MTKNGLNEGITGTALVDLYEQLCSILKAMFDTLEVKPVISEHTDAGPGVGVSNLEVRARMAEISRIHGSDRRVRIHRAGGD